MTTNNYGGVYFESPWSILSAVGLLSALTGVMVAGITSFSYLSAVPIVVSAACALSNGLCFYAFYTDTPVANRVVAAAVADIAWGVSISYCTLHILVALIEIDTRGRTFLLQLPDSNSIPTRQIPENISLCLLGSNNNHLWYPARYPRQPIPESSQR